MAIPVFLGIVGLSACFFVLFTLPLREPDAGPPAAEITQGTAPSARPSPAAASGSAAGPVSAKPAVPAASKPPARPRTPPVVYPSPASLLEAVTKELRAGNLEGAVKLGGQAFAADARTNFFKLLLVRGGYRVPADGPVFVEAGTASGIRRYEIRLEPESKATPPPGGALWVDLEKNPATASWQMRGVVIPPALLSQGTAELRRQEVVLDPAGLERKPDPLQRTHTFLSAVFSRNFQAARQVTDPQKVTQEKLAGLCIVFEEGGWRLAGERPVVMTATNREAAVAVVRVRSEKEKTDAEIGVTLHPGADGSWMIVALDFSRLLDTYVRASGAGQVFYSPVVRSPQGGESLVVYFDFGSAELVPRALAQLDIVARLLATDTAKKLRISGHADDLGTDDYNYQLSAARAKNVRAHLRRLGVHPAQIETLGFGATAPLESNKRPDGSDNPEGRSRNRRTEIYLDF